MIDATDRNNFNTDNYQFYFNNFLTSKCIKIENGVLTKETVKASGLKTVSAVCGIIATCFMIYNNMNPDTAIKTAVLVAAGTSNILNKINSFFNQGYVEEDKEGRCNRFTDQQSCHNVDRCSRYSDQYNCLADQQSCCYADRVSLIRETASQMFHHMRKDEPSQGWTPLTDEYMNKKWYFKQKG